MKIKVVYLLFVCVALCILLIDIFFKIFDQEMKSLLFFIVLAIVVFFIFKINKLKETGEKFEKKNFLTFLLFGIGSLITRKSNIKNK